MRDKIIYGTVRQYHIWFIEPKPLRHSLIAKIPSVLYNR